MLGISITPQSILVFLVIQTALLAILHHLMFVQHAFPLWHSSLTSLVLINVQILTLKTHQLEHVLLVIILTFIVKIVLSKLITAHLVIKVILSDFFIITNVFSLVQLTLQYLLLEIALIVIQIAFTARGVPKTVHSAQTISNLI